jgi:flagellar hook assembly protein FlgD
MVTKLSGNYPNPFNPTTTIEFSLAQQQKVRIDIYNIKGEKVKTLVNSTLPADNHKVVWNGNDDNQRQVASGMYFYKMQTQGFSKTHKMLLIK